jgi:hypothetical protein
LEYQGKCACFYVYYRNIRANCSVDKWLAQYEHPMQYELRVDLLSPKSPMVFLPQPPNGVRVSGLRSEPFNGPTPTDIAVFFLVTVPSGIAINVFSAWLHERIRNHRADRFRVQGREPKDAADFERIVSEELEIGKND